MTWTGITGSAAGDTEACPARLALPTCREPAGERAERGNELHAFARCVTIDPANREKYIAAVSEEYRHTAKGMNLEAALDDIEVLGCEVAFVLNVKDQTCRRIGDNINRQYVEHLAETNQPPLTLYDIPFTVDVLGRSKVTKAPVELDYKSGQSIGEIEEHAQRQISAAGLMFYFDVDEVISRVAYIWDNGNINHDGFPFTTLDAWDVCDRQKATIDRVIEARKQLANGVMPTVYPDRDRQCKYCNAFNYCPYWNNLIKSAIHPASYLGPEFVSVLEGLPISETAQAELFDKIKDAQRLFDEVEDKLKERIYRNPLPLNDEYEYRAKEQAGRTSFNASKARGLIVTLLTEAGYSQPEIDTTMATLLTKGAPFPVIRKLKRKLPLLKKTA